MTTPNEITPGPRYTPAHGPDGKGKDMAPRAACGEIAWLDHETGVCRACWRARAAMAPVLAELRRIGRL